MKRRYLLRISALLVAESLGLLRVSHAAERGDRVKRIAFVGPSSPSTVPRAIRAFWERLRELGWIQDENVTVDLFWANGQLDRLPTLMSEAVGHSPDVIVTYTTPAGLAAKKATATIPIVDAMMGDPIRTGLADSLARPGSNLTGLSLAYAEGMGGKWLELLRELVPRVSTVAVVGNLDNLAAAEVVKELEAAAPRLRLSLRIFNANTLETLERGMNLARQRSQAAVVLPDTFLMIQRRRVIDRGGSAILDRGLRK
jgi:putative ABC transport system substrate-binding protein